MSVIFRVFTIIGFYFLLSFSAFGKDAVELQSRYVGDGWFEYRLRTLEDPFLSELTFDQLAPSPFTNYLESVVPTNWTNSFRDGEWRGIKFDNSVSQPRITEILFSVKSSSTHFRRESYGFNTGIHVTLAEDYFGRESLGGYLNLECLVPCLPEEADGSSPILISSHEFISDILLTELVVTDGSVHGVTFSWDNDSTVQLDASHNLAEWTPVARFFGSPPSTTWTTEESLNSYGTFFRLSLISARHLESALVVDSIPLVQDISAKAGGNFPNSSENKTVDASSLPTNE